MKELTTIQSRLNAPKRRKNEYGGYYYRSCEDILEAVKPLLEKTGCHLTLSDEIVEISGRIYVKATAKLMNSAGEVVIVAAQARETETKKGMDEAQITGAASSYARKYALNGLFCIDDVRDADATNTHGKETSSPTHKREERPTQVDGVDFEEIEHAVMCCTTTMELTTLFKDHPEWASIKTIVNLFTRRKNELNGTTRK